MPLLVPAVGTAALAALAFVPRVSNVPLLQVSFLAAAGVLVVWLVLLGIRQLIAPVRLEVTCVPVRAHWVQACVQIVIYTYWGWYWDEVGDHIPHFVGQLAFFYAFDSLLNYTFNNKYRLGFGPLPIIFSTNLFIWFRDDWFLLQFAMLAAGSMLREFITWNKDGRRCHIFNPSAISLTLFSIALLATGTSDLTWGEDIARTVAIPPHIFLVAFGLGLIVQFFFSVTLTTVWAAIALFACNAVYTWTTGVYHFLDENIPVGVFLGVHFLVTDPSTSPRTPLGRGIFGVIYGVLVFATYGLLDWYGQPTFYDKLLCVPFLNLSIRWIDRLATSRPLKPIGLHTFGLRFSPRGMNLAHMTLWAVVFLPLVATGWLAKSHPGQSVDFWVQAAEQGRHRADERLRRLLAGQSEVGNASASYRLGKLWLDESASADQALVAASRANAIQYIQLASHQGYGEASHHLSQLLQSGEFDSQDPRLMNTFMRQASPEEQSAFSDRNLVAAYTKKAVRQGHFSASLQYMKHVLFQSPGAANNEIVTAAMEAIRSQIDQDTDGSGNYLLGYASLNGIHTKRDGPAAVKHFDAAANQGNAAACYELGTLYLHGTFVEANREQALVLMEQACALGEPKACTWMSQNAER